jgi:hypothetical protein
LDAVAKMALADLITCTLLSAIPYSGNPKKSKVSKAMDSIFHQ